MVRTLQADKQTSSRDFSKLKQSFAHALRIQIWEFARGQHATFTQAAFDSESRMVIFSGDSLIPGTTPRKREGFAS